MSTQANPTTRRSDRAHFLASFPSTAAAAAGGRDGASRRAGAESRKRARQRGLRVAHTSGGTMFLLSGIVSAATAPRRVSLSRHSVTPPNGWVRGGVDPSARTRSLVLASRNRTRNKFGARATSGVRVLGAPVSAVLHPRCYTPVSQDRDTRLGAICATPCAGTWCYNRSARVHPDDRSVRDTIRSRGPMDETTLLPEN